MYSVDALISYCCSFRARRQ